MAVASYVYFSKVLEIVDTAPELRNTATGVCWQTCCAAAGSAVGGLLGGPAGAVIGGGVGIYTGYRTTHPYDSILVVLREMDDAAKEEVQRRVQELVGSVGIEELVAFVQREVGRHMLLDVVKEVARSYQQRSIYENDRNR